LHVQISESGDLLILYEDGDVGWARPHAGRLEAFIPDREEEADQGTSEEFEVDFILDSKLENGVEKFLVRWRGYSADHDTWEPTSNFSDPQVVEAFRNKAAALRLTCEGCHRTQHKDNFSAGMRNGKRGQSGMLRCITCTTRQLEGHRYVQQLTQRVEKQQKELLKASELQTSLESHRSAQPVYIFSDHVCCHGQVDMPSSS
jgi:hypothetical protein